MPERITFRSLSITNFRGFRESQQFDLGGSAIILSGPNGTGKTSFFDAIQWLLLGDIERLAALKVHLNDEYILNEYSNASEATVEAALELGDEEVWLARVGRSRTGGRGNTLQLRVGKQLYSDAEAEHKLAQLLIPKTKMELRRLLMTSALLQQDVMRYFLEAKPRERYEHLNQLLGLDQLATFEERLQTEVATATTEANRAREDELKSRQERQSLQALVAELEAKQDQLGPVDSARQYLSQTISRNANVVYVGPPSSLEEARNLFAELRSLRRRIAEMELASSRLRAELSATVPIQAEEVAISDKRVAEAVSSVQQLEADVGTAAVVLERAEQRSQAFARLAASALPLLSDICPVCGQHINKPEVASRLEGAASDATELVRVRQVKADLDGQLEAARRRLQEARAHRAEISARQARLARLRSQMDDLSKEVSSIQGTSSRVEVRLDLTAEEPGMSGAQDLLRALRELEEAVERILLIFASQESTQLRETRARVDEMLSLEPTRARRVEELAEREANTKKLLRATKDARVSVVRRRISSLQPLFTDIFARLDPHPSFKLLDLEHEVYRAQGTTVPLAIDPIEDKTANPMLVFSTSQANITALSLFLALSLATGQSALPFVLLDDPLQSLDDVNVLGFADLCRFIREERQLILSTHDRRFADLLERKLAPRTTEQRTRVIQFTGWDRSGPSAESRDVNSELGLPRLLSA